MSQILIDTNVILDITTQNSEWYEWSVSKLEWLDEENNFFINNIIFSELSISLETIEECINIIKQSNFELLPIPLESCFLAGKVFKKYRQNSGSKHMVLPDFFIGAHAAVSGMKILTRDIRRYQSYFPSVQLVSPDIH